MHTRLRPDLPRVGTQKTTASGVKGRAYDFF